jgi:hypothetical protein
MDKSEHLLGMRKKNEKRKHFGILVAKALNLEKKLRCFYFKCAFIGFLQKIK